MVDSSLVNFQTLFREGVKFSNRSKISKPPSTTLEMVHTGVSEILIAIGMSEKSPKMFLILHVGKVPKFSMIFKN